MILYVLKRILWLIPITIAVTLIIYLLMDMAPGTIVDSMMTDDMTAEERAELLARYDLDKPVFYRYGKYMLRLIQGDLGLSHITKLSVWDTYISKLPNTLVLAFAALVFGASTGIPLGIQAAKHGGKIRDNMTTVFSLLGLSMPNFWLGLLFLLLFSLRLGWLPAGGNRNGILSIIMPMICGGVGLMAVTTRQTRSSMLEVLKADYLRTARAKGVPEKAVIRKHALGNAWIPILTTMGNSLSHTVAGSAIIESVFAWPGVGRMMVDAVNSRDVMMATGCAIMTTFLYVIIQLLVDLMYAYVDPRIRSRFANSGRIRKRLL